ncbi:DNA adenine methylase [Croceimicrobium sp.]|uniref:DNA adenine methylase n=1 Tax=Croceimicrobium sp. TaxID=2828340 RepID=UPI003BA8868E
MKTPVSYYGGKQNMLRHILPLIPKHQVYLEPFFGGGAVFFAKEPSPSEVINDNNHMVVNFYQVAKTHFEDLKKKVEATLFSRASYSVAWSIYRVPHLFSALQQAWAFYVGTNMGFACQIGSWGYDKYGKRTKSFLNKKLAFDSSVVDRLATTTVECSDACSVIQRFDTEDTFIYVDPPYVGTALGHYGGYTEADYERLLQTLSSIKGKFLLSSFPSELLSKYQKQHGWHTKTFNKSLAAHKSENGASKPRKTEMLTANYPFV